MTTAKISKPGEYSGYSEKIYSEVLRTSRYLYIRGNNLAIDIYRPARDGEPAAEPYPVILQNKRYQRRGPWTDLDLINDWVQRGYVVAVLDPRGAGASFGYRPGDWSLEEALDGKEVVEWLASQPYCNGNVGMWGFSYMGGIQYLIAATLPPHLKAIVPAVATIDQFFRHPNGVVWTPPRSPRSVVYPLDSAGKAAQPPQNVDEDPNGVMLEQAMKEHEASIYTDQIYSPGQTFRNSYKAEIKNMSFIAQSAITYQDSIRAGGVAIYNVAGWFDAAPAQALAAWKLWGSKVIIGPWAHGATMTDLVKTEHLRWFDYHLKGIQNGIQDEPLIRYYTFHSAQGSEWRSSAKWPLPSQRTKRLYLSSGRSGTSASVNDGSLVAQKPAASDSKDEYSLDYSIKVFEENGADKYRENERTWNGDMEKSVDAKGLTYTSDPLDSDTELTGTPQVRLWVSSTATDGYFIAFLEEVEGSTNISHYVTDGMIRASCRALSQKSPWTDLGMAYHRCYDVDYRPLIPGEPVELIFDFYPISYVFGKGNRIRLSITGSLQSNYAGFVQDPAPVITLYHGSTRPSFLELPEIPETKNKG